MITRRLYLSLLIFSLISTMSFAFQPPDGKGGGNGGGGGEDPPELPNYSIEYLGTLGGTWSMTYGMNNYGDVVGAAERADGTEITLHQRSLGISVRAESPFSGEI